MTTRTYLSSRYLPWLQVILMIFLRVCPRSNVSFVFLSSFLILHLLVTAIPKTLASDGRLVLPCRWALRILVRNPTLARRQILVRNSQPTLHSRPQSRLLRRAGISWTCNAHLRLKESFRALLHTRTSRWILVRFSTPGDLSSTIQPLTPQVQGRPILTLVDRRPQTSSIRGRQWAPDQDSPCT